MWLGILAFVLDFTHIKCITGVFTSGLVNNGGIAVS